MHNIEIRKESDLKVFACRKFKFPQTWDELTARNMISIGKIQYLKTDQAHIILFRELSGLSWIWVSRFFPAEQYYTCVQNLLLPLLAKPVMKKGVMMHTVDGFIGMDDEFRNFSFGRWCMVEAFYNSWMESQDPEVLNTLCALIYTPKLSRWFNIFHRGSGWGKYENADRLIPFWRKKPRAMKTAIAMHYGALRAGVINTYKSLFPKPPKKDPLNTEPVKKPPPVDYHALTISLSGGIFGNREATEAEPVHNVLKLLDMRAHDDAKNPSPKKTR